MNQCFTQQANKRTQQPIMICIRTNRTTNQNSTNKLGSSSVRSTMSSLSSFGNSSGCAAATAALQRAKEAIKDVIDGGSNNQTIGDRLSEIVEDALLQVQQQHCGGGGVLVEMCLLCHQQLVNKGAIVSNFCSFELKFPTAMFHQSNCLCMSQIRNL